ncbi:MAG: hypothetical protein JST10_04830 [Bacteroidetes bacterium]|nr:hypothetical protein [Bacteroidota bacterium]MBS1631879.1 hypothetical protein [Bacteroidota bacterium]
MEVHAHTHTPRKKWHHYFWEFFMLFLAVTLGFLVENMREHIVEHKREKQYIQSLIADLKDDSLAIQEAVMAQEKRTAMMDSMIRLLNDPSKIHGNEGSLYYWARLSPRLGPLPVNTRTFEQLKSSGNFRLIRNIETSNKIMSYYEEIPSIRLVEQIFLGEFNQYKIFASRIFDPAVFISMEKQNGDIIRSDANPPLQSYDPALLKQLSVFAVYMNGSARGIMTFAKQLAEKGKTIIEYLQKEYHLD